ncbi:DUF2946 family protein [Pseudomonadota bacterium]
MRRATMAWLAVFALFVQAMAPLSAAWASEAFGTSMDGELQVICTASGVKTIAIGEDGQPVNPPDMVSCPMCVVHSASAILSPQLGETVTHSVVEQDTYVPVLNDVHANLWRASPRPPRGPPLSA